MQKRRTLFLFALIAAVAMALGAFVAMQRFLAPPHHPLVADTSSTEMVQAVLCYPDLQHDRLVRQPTVFGGLSKQQVVTEIVVRLQSPNTPSLEPALPPNARLRAVRWEGTTVVLDFDGGLTDPSFWQGSEVAHLRLQALVHSLTSLPQVRRVRLTVNGQPVETLGGHEEISEPLEPDPNLR